MFNYILAVNFVTKELNKCNIASILCSQKNFPVVFLADIKECWLHGVWVYFVLFFKYILLVHFVDIKNIVALLLLYSFS